MSLRATYFWSFLSQVLHDLLLHGPSLLPCTLPPDLRHFSPATTDSHVLCLPMCRAPYPPSALWHTRRRTLVPFINPKIVSHFPVTFLTLDRIKNFRSTHLLSDNLSSLSVPSWRSFTDGTDLSTTAGPGPVTVGYTTLLLTELTIRRQRFIPNH